MSHFKFYSAQRYHVEFFGNRNASSSEAEQYLGSMVVMTNAQGVAKANWTPKVRMPSITANVTDHLGGTSELSPAVQLK